MGKRRAIPDGDAEDLNKLFQMGFVSLEEVDSQNDKGQEQVVKKSKKSDWNVTKMIKSMAPPCPEIGNAKKWAKFSAIKKVVLAGILEKGYDGPTEIQEAILGDMTVKELVGQGKGVHAVSRGFVHQFVYFRHAVEDGIVRVHM